MKILALCILSSLTVLGCGKLQKKEKEIEVVHAPPGENGANGEEGTPGTDGTQGEAGKNGQDGKDGLNAVSTECSYRSGSFYVEYKLKSLLVRTQDRAYVAKLVSGYKRFLPRNSSRYVEKKYFPEGETAFAVDNKHVKASLVDGIRALVTGGNGWKKTLECF